MTAQHLHRREPPAELAELYAAHLREWEQRFAAALDAAGFDSVVICAGEEQLVHRDDASYPFVAEPYFKAWVPLPNHPGSIVQLIPGERPRLIYFQDSSFWHEPPAAPTGDWLAHFELCCVSSEAAREAALAAGGHRVAVIGPPGSAVPDGAVRDDPALLAALDFTRAHKTAYEVACIERANAMAAAGHRAAQQAFAEDATEFMIDQVYCAAAGQRALELPYRSIVALNAHAAVLHYQNLRHEKPGVPSSFLLDAGASFNGYAADVTRTVTRGTEAMQALIEAVDVLQQRVCSETRGGVDFIALNALAHELLAVILQEHGLLRCSAAAAYELGITRSFLPHGLGHLLGLQVHDAGGHMAAADASRRTPPPEHPMLRLTRVLEPGFVVTIEPGLYFIPSLLQRLRSSGHRDAIDWPAVDALTRFGGVRIEDDVLVTESGARNLSRPALEAAGIS
ncbi:MAG TPA: Xaa-Pro dipeptidase [Gammaproteobacteria bacterium]|nr:Xaa-Pro dipeptidase [Gammaproteobacteria bacterium]